MAIRRLDERTFQFACDVVRFCRTLSRSDREGRQVSWQLLRSATSVGANVEEASAAFTRREFACKYAIALREAREARYWLRLIDATALTTNARLPALLGEANELVAILIASVRRARKPEQPKRKSEIRS
jgi:four helix bundle protein